MESIGTEDTQVGTRTTATMRISGGERSQQWLSEHGYRNDNDDPNATAAWNLVASYFGFSWELRESDNPAVLKDATGKPQRDTAGKIITQPRYYVHATSYPLELVDGFLYSPSLADLVRHARGEIRLNLVEITGDRIQKYKRVLPIVTAHHRVGPAFANLVQSNNTFRTPPPGHISAAIGRWLNAASEGAESTIVCFVCPDWAVDEHERYTFDNVGCGNGLVARRALAGLPIICKFVQDHGINARVVVAIGDFEGNDPTTCERVGVDQVEFRRRCSESLNAFRKEAERRIPGISDRLITYLATDLAGGNEEWELLLRQGQQRIEQYGIAKALGISQRDGDAIIAARRSLYERWHGKGVDAEAKLKAQLPEYGAMGKLAERAGSNPLILGADAAVMAHGFQLLREPQNTAPVLYLFNRDY